jgi:tyrosinase
MKIALALHGSTTTTNNYVSWSPASCEVRMTEPEGAAAPVTVRLRNQRTDVGGQVVFYTTQTSDAEDEIELVLPPNGAPAQVLVGGRHQRASIADADAAIEVVEVQSGTVLSVTPLMVRIRKDAEDLTPDERSRFLEALATLNNQGKGRFTELRDMHRAGVGREAHGRDGFLPWHRAYMLDFERELQAIDPSVALPYWNFQNPAPKLFSREFLGADDGSGTPAFAPTNPLRFWKTDNGARILRAPDFRSDGAPDVLSDADTLALGDQYGEFRFLMEDNPHGFAHTSFSGDISRASTAPMDPLFFLLHANVDRLWAVWQAENGRWDGKSTEAYPLQGSGAPGADDIGHHVDDTMWPWNGDTKAPRPPNAPGGALASSPIVAAPGPAPTVANMIDYQGRIDPSNRLGYDYGDVAFRPLPAVEEAKAMSMEAHRERAGERVARVREVRLARVERLEAAGLAEPSTEMTRKTMDATGGVTRPEGTDLQRREFTLAWQALDAAEASPHNRAEAIRLGAVALGNREEGIGRLLEALLDRDRPAALRHEALAAIKRLRFTSALLRELRPQLIETLHALMDDPDDRLRESAVEMLAQEKDGEVQLRLLAGLTGEGEALVAPARAIQLLAYDVHAEHFPVLRRIARSPGEPQVREEAVRVLSADPTAAGLLIDLLRDRGEEEGVRQVAAVALQSVAPVEFEREARAIVLDDADHPELRAMLVAALARFANPASLQVDSDLSSRVAQMADDAGTSPELRKAARRYQASRAIGGP